MTQAAHTALANGRGKLEERLARWLLMADDRAEERELPFTHELGVRRAGVMVALNGLEAQGFIRRRRGTIAILDREGLAKTTNGFYGGPGTEARRLFRRAAAE
jgi:CRP-like cAMP-binding protein